LWLQANAQRRASIDAHTTNGHNATAFSHFFPFHPKTQKLGKRNKWKVACDQTPFCLSVFSSGHHHLLRGGLDAPPPQQDGTMDTVCIRCTKLDVARRRAARRIEGLEVHAAHTCHATHAGVVVVGPVGRRTALFYLPNRTTTPFVREALGSAHQEMQALQTVGARVAAFRAARLAPHGLNVGDVLEEVKQGLTNPWYHRVVAVPGPRRATIAPWPAKTLASGWEGTTTAPEDTAAPTVAPIAHKARQRDVVFTIENGVPMAPLGKGWFVRPWNGKPHHRSNDR